MKKITIVFSAILLFISFACQDNKEVANLKTSDIKLEEQKPIAKDPDDKAVLDFQQVQTEAPQNDKSKRVQQTVTKKLES